MIMCRRSYKNQGLFLLNWDAWSAYLEMIQRSCGIALVVPAIDRFIINKDQEIILRAIVAPRLSASEHQNTPRSTDKCLFVFCRKTKDDFDLSQRFQLYPGKNRVGNEGIRPDDALPRRHSNRLCNPTLRKGGGRRRPQGREKMMYHSGIREVKGPTPHSVALKAKRPLTKSRECDVLNTRHEEQITAANLASLKKTEQQCLKNEWQHHSNRRIFKKSLRMKVDEAMQGILLGTEDRRKRLRELLEAEEKELFMELESKEETLEDRKQKMRERATFLLEKKEKERQKLVAEKRDQQFREECETLREILKQTHAKEVDADRKVQLALKEELKKQKQREEELFRELWEEDRLAKDRREAEEAEKRARKGEKSILGLNAQIAEHEAQKREAQRLKEEEGQLLEQEKTLMKLEDEKAQKEKVRKQQEIRDMFEKSVREKMERVQREQQDELNLDMELIGQALQGLESEAKEKRLKREVLLKEQKLYLEYKAQLLEEEKLQEKELEQIVKAEMERSWAKKAEQLRLAKEARKQLMKDIMDTRQLQIQKKLEINAKQQEELAQEQEQIEESLKKLNQEEMEHNARRAHLAMEYREHLKAQIAHQEQARTTAKEEEWREYEEGLEAEKAYDEKIKQVILSQDISPKNIHPMRRTTFAESPTLS
ncbi:cilia- and flagella-associated protein 53 [Tachyglossus aculeatus]|uniref:cilia- and flagella-associated protein 53 n=1 Tax=Tachyglossus aculeatus TaxID=9261 RepID=UPI0018F3728E|nr:cilia- and flagella-associated protein 53 [Tachyglossus aculeatus]